METDLHIYLFEFKLDGSEQAALAQIQAKQYFQPYLNKKKPLTLVGINFDKAARNIGDWKQAPYHQD